MNPITVTRVNYQWIYGILSIPRDGKTVGFTVGTESNEFKIEEKISDIWVNKHQLIASILKNDNITHPSHH